MPGRVRRPASRSGVDRGVDAPCRDAQQLGDDGVGVAQNFALANQLSGDRDITFMYGFPALDISHDRQYRYEQEQHRQRCYHSPDDPAGPPLLPDIFAFNIFLGNLTNGCGQRRDLVPESSIAQGQARIAASPGHIEILGLGRENTAERVVTSGGGRVEVTAVLVPDPGASSDDDQQMICALGGHPVRDLIADPVRPGGLR